MIDYVFTKMPAYDGTYRKVDAIETFNPNTGETIGYVRRLPFESKAAWIARALTRAADNY